MRSYSVRVGLDPMAGEKGTQTHTEGTWPYEKEAENGVMLSQAKKHQGLPETMEDKKRQRRILC